MFNEGLRWPAQPLEEFLNQVLTVPSRGSSKVKDKPRCPESQQKPQALEIKSKPKAPSVAGEQLEKAEPVWLQVRQGPWGRGSNPLTPTFLPHWGPECSLWGVPMGPELCVKAHVKDRDAMLPPRKPPKFPGPITRLEGAGPMSGAKGGGAGINSLPTGHRRPGQLGAHGPPNKALLQLRKPRHRGAEEAASARPTACTQPQPWIG